MTRKRKHQPARPLAYATLALTLFVTPACAQEAEPDAAQVEQPAEAAPASDNPFLVQQEAAPADDGQQRPSLVELAEQGKRDLEEQRRRTAEAEARLDAATATADAAEARADANKRAAAVAKEANRRLEAAAKNPD